MNINKKYVIVGITSDYRACACLDTSRLGFASPSQAHVLSKTEPPKLGKSKADGCGFRAEPLAKSPHKPSAIFFRF